jgi:putative nucleotidyltransferase with HDIG domain
MAETAATTPLRVVLERPIVRHVAWLKALPSSAWAYWVLIVGPATFGAVLVALHLPQSTWQRFGVLTVAATIAQLSSVQMSGRRVFHPAIVFAVAGALLLQPGQLILMCVIQHLPEWLKQRYAWYIQPFNIANYIWATMAAWAAVHAIGGVGAMSGVAAASVFVVANRLLLAPMLQLGRGLSLRATNLLSVDDLGLEFVLALMAVPFAVLWLHRPALAVIGLAPLALIQMTQRTMHRLEVASATISSQNEGLEAASKLVVERSTAALEALSATVDARDAYTAGHSKRVREYALEIGRELDLDARALEALAQAALLHDIGKIGVPDSVLLKEGDLTQADWLVMRSHPEEGARIIERLGYLDDVVPAIRHHHERPDGRGYPAGLRGEEIPLAAQIIHVADALDAITTRRVYRSEMNLEAALDEIRRGTGLDFARDCVEALYRAVERGSISDPAPVPVRSAA